MAEHVHRFSRALDVWQHPFWKRWAVDDLDEYAEFARGSGPAAGDRGGLRAGARGPHGHAARRARVEDYVVGSAPMRPSRPPARPALARNAAQRIVRWDGARRTSRPAPGRSRRRDGGEHDQGLERGRLTIPDISGRFTSKRYWSRKSAVGECARMFSETDSASGGRCDGRRGTGGRASPCPRPAATARRSAATGSPVKPATSP